jgi:hypothetical protein
MQEKELALRQIAVLRKALTNIIKDTRITLGISPSLAFGELRKWKTRAVSAVASQISYVEGENLRLVEPVTSAPLNLPQFFMAEAKMCDEFLAELADAIERNPESVLATASPKLTNKEKKVAVSSPQKNVVFIVHGHDEPNLNGLKDLLKDRYHLTPIVLSSQPEGGRTIIEKFEEEAQKAAFAFVLLTPDDTVRKDDGEYSQARPNVAFELGWFYGKLGRKKVCILFKKGTRIHSDLEGVIN